MHHALPEPAFKCELASIPEVLQLIFTHLDDDKPALAQLARVSHIFHDLAIAVLWSGVVPKGTITNLYHQKSRASWVGGSVLRPLLDLLPSHLISWPITFPDNVGPKIIGTVTDADCARVKHYSCHVRRIVLYDGVPGVPVHSVALFGIFKERADDVFPKLQVLEVDWETLFRYRNAEWMWLVGQSLLSLTVTFPSPIRRRPFDTLQPIISCIQQLPRRVPSLRDLHFLHTSHSLPLVDHAYGIDVSATLLAHLRTLTNLKRFTWPSQALLKPEVLEMLSQCLELSDLTLSNLITPIVHDGHKGLDFPTLSHLKLEGYEPPITSFICGLSNPQLLLGLDLNSQRPFPHEDEDEPPTPSESSLVPALLSAVNLIDLSLDLRDIVVGWTQHIRPLVQTCDRMVRFYLRTGSIVEGFSDEALMEMASTWRGLERLVLLDGEEYPEPPFTILGLAPFAQFCPNLSHLELRVTTELETQYGAQSKAALERVMESRFPDSSKVLRRLALRGASIAPSDASSGFLSPFPVARLLHRLWPTNSGRYLKLKDIRERSRMAWDLVQHNLELMRPLHKEMDMLERKIAEQSLEISRLRMERDEAVKQLQIIQGVRANRSGS